MITAVLKLIGIVVWALVWLGPVWLAKYLGKLEWRDRFMRWFCAGGLWIVGIRLHVRGTPSAVRPLLMVSNHLSYFDILILGSQVAARFTPKSEIGGWPFIGSICRMTDSVLVDRRVEKVKAVSHDIRAALAKGDVVSLFPEATTSNGMHILPFKSSFFNLAEEPIDGRDLHVQPVAITYTHIRRLPVDSTQWPVIAWVGDAYMMPHLMEALKLGRMDVEISFLPAVTVKEHEDRKKLAAHCHEVIAREIENIKSHPAEPVQGILKSLMLRLPRSKA